MTITAQDVKTLRDRTGVSMMECKKALTESEGDMDKAIEILRKRGIAKAEKKADRGTGNGTIAAAIVGDKAAIVQVFCETDFVARNEDFVALAKKIAEIAAEKGEETAKSEAESLIKEGVLKLGENIQLGDIKLVEGSELDFYIHSNGNFGVVISTEEVEEEPRHDIAMHIAAMNPEVINPEEITQDLVDKEKEIWKEQLATEGKPADIIDKIMMGKEQKFRAEKALMTQDFVKDPDQKISDVVGDGKINTFIRLAI